MLRSIFVLAIMPAVLARCASLDHPRLPDPASSPLPGEHQIDWQRNLADALAKAKAEHRPLFVAVNMDGESASERIVRENYRDPRFVASTRHCVCLVASVFRHNARDHDDRGRRIPCPRLGSVTCGEHMALEPILFEELLQGERVAPRHCLIRTDGTKAWDHSLMFDLRDLDALMARSAAAERQRRGAGSTLAVEPSLQNGQGDTVASAWSALAAARDATGRSRFEQALAAVEDAATLAVAIDALRTSGDGASGDALRIAVDRLIAVPGLDEPGMGDRLADAAVSLGLASDLAGILQERWASIGRVPVEWGPRPGDATLWALLGKLAGSDPRHRSALLARFAVSETGTLGESGRQAGFATFGESDARAVEHALAAGGGGVSLPTLLDLAGSAEDSAAPGTLPRTADITDAMPGIDALATELEDLDVKLRDRPGDPELLGRIAKATLDLGRRRAETGAKGVALLLEDAARAFAKALASQPDRYDWWIESARTAYFQSKFDLQVEYGRRALRLALGTDSEDGLPRERALAAAGAETSGVGPKDVLRDGKVIEALRWIGDGEARSMGVRAGGDPAAEIAGMIDAVRALGLVAASPFGDPTDWTSLVSLLQSLGLGREAVAVATAAAMRYPAATEVHRSLNAALWQRGRIDLAPEAAAAIARRHPRSAEARWHVGYAHLLAAEDRRRAEAPDLALQSYQSAANAFAAAKELRADLAANCDYYIACSWLGRGMAHLLVDRQARAADCLVRAVATAPTIVDAKDGLGREPLDLVDQILEWRARGRSPVDPSELLDRLLAADPGKTLWAVAVSDAELREALRADGRNPHRVEQDTVDAGGEPIRMLMGLPTPEGDVYLRAAMAAGRRAMASSDNPEDRIPLAQAATIWAERMLRRRTESASLGADDALLAEARRGLAEAASLLGLEPPAADPASLEALARTLRSRLGPARPRLREGR